MTTVIGLGNLGLAVARRLAMVGLSPVGVDIDENQRRLWTSLTDAPVVARASDLDLDSLDRVLVVVNGSKPAFRVIQDIVDLPRTTPIVVYVLTTVAPDEAATLSQFNRDSLRMIELPVTGGELGALAGTLVAMAAGPLDEIERDFLNTTIASHVVEFGDYGQPAIAKLLNNVVGA